MMRAKGVAGDVEDDMLRDRLEPEQAAALLRELDVSPEHLSNARRLLEEHRLAQRRSRRRIAVGAAVFAGLLTLAAALLAFAGS